MSLVNLTTEDVSDIFNSVYRLYVKKQLFEPSGAKNSSRPKKRLKTSNTTTTTTTTTNTKKRKISDISKDQIQEIQRTIVLNRNSSKINKYTIQANVFEKFDTDDLLNDNNFRKHLYGYNKDLYNLLQLNTTYDTTQLNCDSSLLIPKSGDLPSERYLDCICRNFEKVIFDNDLGARQEFQESRDKYIEKIISSGKKFVESLLLILVNYNNVMQINNISKEYKIIDQKADNNLKRLFESMKHTESAFLGLNKNTLNLHKIMKEDDYNKKLMSEMVKDERYTYRGKTYIVKKLNTRGIDKLIVLNNILGPVSLYNLQSEDERVSYEKFKPMVTDKYFPVDNFKTIELPDTDTEITIFDFIAKCKAYAKNFPDDSSYALALNNIQPFGMFHKNYNKKRVYSFEKKLEKNKGPWCLSMDRLLAYIYNYIEVSENNNADESNNIKTKFLHVVEIYKSKERTDILEQLNYYFVQNELYTNDVADIPFWYLFGNYNKPNLEINKEQIATDTFKMYYDIDSSLSSNFGVQYYDKEQLCHGTVNVFGKNPVLMESELQNLLSELKNLWLFLAEFALNDLSLQQELGEDFGIYFYNKPETYTEEQWNNDLENKFMTSEDQFLKMYLQNSNFAINNFKNLDNSNISGKYDAKTMEVLVEDNNTVDYVIKSQDWKNLKNLQNVKTLKDDKKLKTFLLKQKNKMLWKMFKLDKNFNYNLFFNSVNTCREYMENSKTETTKVLKYEDRENFAENLWDFLYNNIIFHDPSAKGVMSYRDYKNSKDNVLIVNNIIDKYNSETDINKQNTILEQSKANILKAQEIIASVQERIKEKNFFTIRNVKIMYSTENWELNNLLNSLFKRKDVNIPNEIEFAIVDDYLSAVVPFEMISKDNETKKKHLKDFNNYFSTIWQQTNEKLSKQQRDNLNKRISQKLSYLEPSLETGYDSHSRKDLEIWNFCKISDIEKINELETKHNTNYSRPLYAKIPKSDSGIVEALKQYDTDLGKTVNKFEPEDENIYFHINKVNPRRIVRDEDAAYLDKKSLDFSDHVNDLRDLYSDDYTVPPQQILRRDTESLPDPDVDAQDNSQYANYMSETFDRFFNEDKYNIVDKDFDPKNNKTMRSRMVFCTGNRNNPGIKTYIDDLVRQINFEGERFITLNTIDANAAKEKLKILTRKLNIMLSLYNNNEATGFRVCNLLSYISSTCFMKQMDNSRGLSDTDISVSAINWDQETKINANALLKVFFDIENVNSNRNLNDFINSSFDNWQTTITESNNVEIKLDLSKNEIMNTFNKDGIFTNTYGLLPIEPISEIRNNVIDKVLLNEGNQAASESYDLSVTSVTFKQLYKFEFENVTNKYILGLKKKCKKNNRHSRKS